ncbi:hypothetical protein FRC08_012103 [Ceratobasidium sp. 394]|nr:hypothetical protein FRC08_012103 [Ceratobasidium sp. 394]
MSTDAALFNLLADAQFYLLDGLADQIKNNEQEVALPPPRRHPPQVIISCLREINNTTCTWSTPVPISADTAQELKVLHKGYEGHMIQSWGRVKPRLDEALRAAQLPTSYTLTTVWARKASQTVEAYEDFYLLKLDVW